MGVYIKGMEMPTSCDECPMCYDMMQCSIAEPIINFFKVKVKEFDFCTERHPRCPLVPVLPHGRLIEADRLKEVFHRNVASGEAFDQLIDIAPTIIPAEEGK